MASEAKVTVTGTPTNPVFNFEIPTGTKGEQGVQGDTGATPNLTIGTVTTTENPSDDSWVSQVVLNGPKTTAALRTTFPTTMKGDKGDIGPGWTPTNLSGVDLNTVIEPGTRNLNDGGKATLALNYPVANAAGALVTTRWGNGSEVVQEFALHPVNGAVPGKWIRGYRGGVWSPWRLMAVQRIDNTAGRAIYTWDDTQNREQLIYGDTGTRILPIPTDPAPPVTGEGVHIRRTGNLVTVSVPRFVITGSNPNGTSLASIPVGFRPPGNTLPQIPALVEFNGNFVFPLQVNPTGTVRAWWTGAMTPTTTGVISGSVTYATNDPWPTTLPGTAAGTIPNL